MNGPLPGFGILDVAAVASLGLAGIGPDVLKLGPSARDGQRITTSSATSGNPGS
jgi:hypothetical protein